MIRAYLYFSLSLIYLIYWIVLLMTGYFSYIENDPFLLEGEYLGMFAGNREQLLFSELIFPGAMALAFIIIFIIKLLFRPIRLPLGLFAFMSLEFFVYREYIFSDQYADYHRSYMAGIPVEFMEPAGYWWEIGFLAIAFLLIALVREKGLPKAIPVRRG